MKRKLSLERIGMRGSIILLIIGTILLSAETIVQIANSRLPDKAAVCMATITGFQDAESSEISSAPTTVVTYQYNGKIYENITLRQYEGSWQKGDILKI